MSATALVTLSLLMTVPNAQGVPVQDRVEVSYNYIPDFVPSYLYSGFDGSITAPLMDNRSGKAPQIVTVRLPAQSQSGDVQALSKSIPCWEQLNSPRQVVLRDLRYNLGHNGLMSFKNTLAKLCKQDYEGAARGIEASKYCRQVGQRCVRNAYTIRRGTYHPDYQRVLNRNP